MAPQEETKIPIALSEVDQRRIEELYRKILRSRAQLLGPDGRSQQLPVSLQEFLRRVVEDLFAGKFVAIVQNDAQLTTVEAAHLLGVSRQFLVNQLER